MKFRNLFFITLAIIFVSSEVFAYATNDELTSPEALINYNYSQVAAEHVQLVKAQNANREYKSGKYVKKPWWRKTWEYIDPAADDGYLMQHNISPGYTWKDW